MPKPQPSVLKRQREQKKLERRLQKAEKRAQRKDTRQQQSFEDSRFQGPAVAQDSSDPYPGSA
jgi:hypothetical protein